MSSVALFKDAFRSTIWGEALEAKFKPALGTCMLRL
jgi:hypothetical protein